MSRKRSRLLTSSLLGIFSAGCLLLSNVAASQAPPATSPLPTPQIFAPGIVSGPANEGSPSFSPDGNTLFFTRSAARWSIILESHKTNGRWSEPTVAPFSGEWSDSSPAFSPDGSFVVFVSVRPLAAGSPQIADSKEANPAASHIWRANRTGSSWSTPTELPASVNAFRFIFRPSVASDGTIYFTAARKDRNLSLFRARYEHGAYLEAEALSFSDGKVKDVDPEIAPDQSFLIFTNVGRRSDEPVHDHLFLVRNNGGVWGAITPIHYAGDDVNGSSSEDNDPRLSPDHRTMYFSSDRAAPVHLPRTHEQGVLDYERLKVWDNSNSNIWELSLATWLDAAKG